MSNLAQRKLDALRAIAQAFGQTVSLANADEETLIVRSLRAIATGCGVQVTYDSVGQPVYTPVAPTVPGTSGGSGSTNTVGGGTGSTTTVGGGATSTTTVGGNGGANSKVEVVGERIEFRDGSDRLITTIVNTSNFTDLVPVNGDEVIELDDSTGKLKYPEITSWIYDAANTRWLSSNPIDMDLVLLDSNAVNSQIGYIPKSSFNLVFERLNLTYYRSGVQNPAFHIYEHSVASAPPVATPWSYAPSVVDVATDYAATPGTLLLGTKSYYLFFNRDAADYFSFSARFRFRKVRP